MAPVLYVYWTSAPCRACIMAANIANIELQYKLVDLFKSEQFEPEFIKINPDHCVPTLVDGDFSTWGSRAIAAYIVDKYAPDHDLFPKDLPTRAHVHKMMDYDLSFVYSTIYAYVYPRVFKNEFTNPGEMERIFKRLNDTVFHDKKYATGDLMTLADLFMIASVTFTECVGYELRADKFPNLAAWIKRMKEADFYAKANTEFEMLKVQINEKAFREE